MAAKPAKKSRGFVWLLIEHQQPKHFTVCLFAVGDKRCIHMQRSPDNTKVPVGSVLSLTDDIAFAQNTNDLLSTLFCRQV